MEGGEKTKRVDKKIDVIREIEGAEYKREPWGDQRDEANMRGIVATQKDSRTAYTE